jgi:hypothetical protein
MASGLMVSASPRPGKEKYQKKKKPVFVNAAAIFSAFISISNHVHAFNPIGLLSFTLKYGTVGESIIKANRPQTQLGIFVVPFTKKEFGNAIIKIFGQDIALLAKEVDLVSPMLYYRTCTRPLSWIQQRAKYFSRLTNTPLLPAIQTTDLPEALPNRMTAIELKKAIELTLSLPLKGVVLFTLDNALSTFGSDILKKIVHPTQK